MDLDHMSECASEDTLSIRAPSVASVDSFLNHFALPENQSMVDLQLKAMKTWNSTILGNLKPDRGRSMASEVIKLIFSLCEKFQVTDLVKYHAIEIHDRYMIANSGRVFEATKRCSREMRKNEEDSLRADFLLHIATCIQLASKSVGSVGAVTPREIQAVLRGMGVRLSCDRILRSELDILKMISYNLNVLTPMEVVECILMLMGMEKMEYRKLYSLCVIIVDAVYLLRKDIYRCFRNRISRDRPHVVNLTDFHRKENDYFLLAAAVIQCAMVIQYPSCSSTSMKLSLIGKLTDIDVQEIASLSQCISYLLIKSVNPMYA